MIWQSMRASNRPRFLHGIERTSFPPCLPLKKSARRSRLPFRSSSLLWNQGNVSPLCLHKNRQKCLKMVGIAARTARGCYAPFEYDSVICLLLIINSNRDFPLYYHEGCTVHLSCSAHIAIIDNERTKDYEKPID